jgi:hypothetical protein
MPKASAMSLGSALKSGAIHIWPAIEPGVRGRTGPQYPTSLATGLPDLVSMISFPFWASSMSAESSTLACETLRIIMLLMLPNALSPHQPLCIRIAGSKVLENHQRLGFAAIGDRHTMAGSLRRHE